LYLVLGLCLGATTLSSRGGIAQDPVAVSPQYYTVRVENARVRILEYRLKPGEKEGMHTHPPGVVCVLSDARIRNTFPDGTSAERPSKQGDVIWRERTTHAAENIGLTEARALAIDVKPCEE
jgi:hypothetical protein